VAGIVVLERGDWYSSGGTFRAMAAGVIRHLPDDPAASKLRDELTLAVDSNLYFLDTTRSFTREMLIHFKTALDCHIIEEHSTSSESAEKIDLHAGYSARIMELRVKLNEILAALR
jgi:hypothetical protein